MVLQACLIICGQGQYQRSLLPQFHVDPGSLQQGCRETWPACLAFPAERNESFLAGFRFRAGGKHSRGRVACARARAAAVENRHPSAVPCKPPTDAEPDHTGADD